MSWAQNTNIIPEWKILIGKPIQISELLKKSQVFKPFKTAFGDPNYLEVQSYITANQLYIVSECLKIALQYASEQSQNKKHPVQALDLLCQLTELGFITWSQDLANLFCNLMLKYYLQGEKQINETSLYHGYLQKLFWLLYSRYDTLPFFVIAMEREQAAFQVVNQLFEYIHKEAISNCIQMMLLVDLKYPTNFSLQIKTHIVSQCQKNIEKFKIQPNSSINQLKVLNILGIYFSLIVRINVVYDSQFLFKLISSQQELILDLVNQQNTIIRNSALLYMQEIERAAATLYVLNTNEQTKRSNIFVSLLQKPKSFQEVIKLFLSMSKITIDFTNILKLFTLALMNRQFQQNAIQTLIKYDLVGFILRSCINNPKNNILSAQVIEFIKNAFNSNFLNGAIILDIPDKSKKISIQMKFISYAFTKMRLIQDKIDDFKHYNNDQFTVCLRISKLISLYSQTYMLEHPCCQQGTAAEFIFKKSIEWTEYFKVKFEEPQKFFNTTLGEYNFQIEQKQPTKYTITRAKQGKQEKAIQNIKTNESIVLPNQQQIEQAVKNSMNIIKNLEIPQNSPNEKTDDDEIKLPQIQNNTLSRNQQNQEEETGGYQSFLKKRMSEAGDSLAERKSKSKTPTKIKSQSKKAKNKWGAEPQEHSSLDEKPRKISENVNKKPKQSEYRVIPKDKIRFIQLTKSKYPKFQKDRLLSADDERLVKWLSLRPSIR